MVESDVELEFWLEVVEPEFEWIVQFVRMIGVATESATPDPNDGLVSRLLSELESLKKWPVSISAAIDLLGPLGSMTLEQCPLTHRKSVLVRSLRKGASFLRHHDVCAVVRVTGARLMTSEEIEALPAYLSERSSRPAWSGCTMRSVYTTAAPDAGETEGACESLREFADCGFTSSRLWHEVDRSVEGSDGAATKSSVILHRRRKETD